MTISIAYFVTPHGYGHIARDCAVMAELFRARPEIHFHIFTRAPQWFVADSLPAAAYTYHTAVVDVGMAQISPLLEDLPATVARLNALLPFEHPRHTFLVEDMRRLDCRLVLCDTSPLGIILAHQAGLPAVLIENFTWDWIYEGYLSLEPALAPAIAAFSAVFAQADYHIQARPVCVPAATPNLVTDPISRQPTLTRAVVRSALNISQDAPVVLITMGGIETSFGFVDALTRLLNIQFIVVGGSPHPELVEGERHKNVTLLPHHSQYYHPNLVHAADAIIGKAGYSTVAETWAAGIGFGYVTRPAFRESAVLNEFIQRTLPWMELSEAEFASGAWTAQVDRLLAQPARPNQVNGANQVRQFILDTFNL